jgi:hypothetical protein
MAIARLFQGLLELPEEFISASTRGGRALFEEMPPKLTRPEIIGGEKALMNYLPKATEEEMELMDSSMKLAKDMAKRGATFEEQVARTGMGIGPDEKLRFEIPDTDARLRLPTDMLEEGETYRVQDVLSHPKLYEFYPDLANKEVRIINEPDKPMSFGAYNFDSQTIDLNVGSMPFIDQDPVSVISGLLHESQHYAQQVENFLRGTSKSKFLKRYTNKAWDQASKADKEKATRDYLKSYGEAESRNVQLRFEDPFYAKTSGSVDKTKGKVFPTTMGQDKDTMAAFNRPLGPTEFINNEGGALDARLDYVSPFPSTVEDMQ